MRILLPSLALLLLASCVSAPPPPPPPAHRIATAPPVTLPAPVPLASDWRDWPQTPGDWEFRRDGGRSSATYSESGRDAALLIVSCPQPGTIRLSRPGAGFGLMTVRTTSVTRVLPVARPDRSSGEPAATLPANDSLLDAIGFSRGRFVVEQAGAPPLVLPAWAEVERVVEDCRA